MDIAERLTKIPPYLFMELRKKINAAKADGWLSFLAIGDPVEATAAGIIDELCRSARDHHEPPLSHGRGKRHARLPQAVAARYRERYGVALDPATEILGLIGSKEGCHHFVLARINPGDVVLMTDRDTRPIGRAPHGRRPSPYIRAFIAKNGLSSDFADIQRISPERPGGMFLNYPKNHPRGLCTRAFWTIWLPLPGPMTSPVCYDNPYS